VNFEYTKHQTPRGAMPDAEVGTTLYLLKSVSTLRLTYQIRMLCFIATTQQKKVVIRLPASAIIHPRLKEFLRAHSKVVKVERT
jgi:hypothetical protein